MDASFHVWIWFLGYPFKSLPEEFWRSKDLAITECVEREDASATEHNQVGGAGTLALCDTAQHARHTTVTCKLRKRAIEFGAALI